MIFYFTVQRCSGCGGKATALVTPTTQRKTRLAIWACDGCANRIHKVLAQVRSIRRAQLGQKSCKKDERHDGHVSGSSVPS